MIKPALLSLMLLAAASAQAQNASPPAPAAQNPQAAAPAANQLTPQQKAEIEQQNAAITQAALKVAMLVDQNRAGEVWDGASPVAKQAVSRDDFISQINRDRQLLGALMSRQEKAIRRMRSNGKSVPPGYYISVAFSTQFANAKQPVRELVSFHLDTDNTWRVTGYTLH